MIALLQDATSRSADELSADLRACRQLRHVSTEALATLVAACFSTVSHALYHRRFIRVATAFEQAFATHGYSCDTCSAITEPEPTRLRYAADRALANIDGRVKLLLCKNCSGRFKAFCHRTFDRDPHIPYSDDLEQMMIAWIASAVSREAKRVERAA